MPYLSSATGDPQELRRRVAFQATRGIPAAEADFLDYRSNAGPVTIEATRIARQVVSPSGIPQRDLPGKLNIGGSPEALGDADATNLMLLAALANLFGYYTYTLDSPVSGVNRWLYAPDAATDAPDYLTRLEDNDIIPRFRVKDSLVSGITFTASPGGNLLVSIDWVGAEHDFHGAVVQTEGGKAALSITGITRTDTTATATTAAPHGLATGDVVAVTGASQAEYNINAVITVTGASTFTYTVDVAAVTPATGTIVYATNGLSITGITQAAGLATATTAVAHGLTTGDSVRISGADQAGYNLDAAVTVTGGSTFTYAVASGTVSPATGTIVYEKLNSALPVFSNTWSGNWDADATDKDLYFRFDSVTAAGVWTVSGKTAAASSYSSTFTAKQGNDSAGNPIFTRTKDETGAGHGPFSEQVKMYVPAGVRPGDTFRVPKRRTARWTQTLEIDRPIGSVNIEVQIDLEPIRIEGGITLAIQNGTLVSPDTPGRQGAATERRGPLTCTVTPTRRVTDLRFQEALHQGSTLSVVLDMRTDTNIGATARPYRIAVLVPSVLATGSLYGPAAGAQNRDEAPAMVAGEPDSTFTYDTDLTTAAHVAVYVENDVTTADMNLV